MWVCVIVHIQLLLTISIKPLFISLEDVLRLILFNYGRHNIWLLPYNTYFGGTMSRTNTANLFDTQYAQVAGTNRTTMKVLEFLVNNSSLVLDDSTTRNILRDRSMMRSSTSCH